MKLKTVKQLLYAELVDMGGIPVRQPFPTSRVEQINPFLLLHHHTSTVPAGSNYKTAGIGPHPHRGFSPVTFIFQGDVHHRDSRGNSSVVKAGGVQWMNSGMGMIHSERPSRELSENGGVQEIIQLWVNSPALEKMNQPTYQAAHKDEMPELSAMQGKGSLWLVSGHYRQTTGPVKTTRPVVALRGEFDKGAADTIEIPEDYNAFIYLLDGKLNIDGFGMVEGLNVAEFMNDGNTIGITALENTRFIVLASPPIDEPLVMYGPFVVNNETQVMQAIRDYQQGKMGMLIEDFES